MSGSKRTIREFEDDELYDEEPLPKKKNIAIGNFG